MRDLEDALLLKEYNDIGRQIMAGGPTRVNAILAIMEETDRRIRRKPNPTLFAMGRNDALTSAGERCWSVSYQLGYWGALSEVVRKATEKDSASG